MLRGNNSNLPSQLLLAAVLLLLAFMPTAAQTTSFTYQGRLNDGGTPANGTYDMQFKLYETGTVGTGSLQGSPNTVTNSTVQVTNGIFTVQMDFGASGFPGADRFLEIGVRPNGSVNPYTILSPRQPITSTPYAIRSVNSALADTATNATQLGGVAANQYVQTNDSRLSDSRTPTANSSNYIQNTTSQQAGSNFNISGNGTSGGTLSGNVINAATQYNIGGNRVLSNAGTANLFAGINAGSANTGGANSFFGDGAGAQNQDGFFNCFFGEGAGLSNTSGFSNSFIGREAGIKTTTSSRNTFVGSNADFDTSNPIGGSDTLLGAFAAANSAVSNSTAIGARASVTQNNSIVLGSINGVNGATADTNVGIGTTAPQFRLHVVGDINTTTQYDIAGNRVLSVIGTNNTFAGRGAGAVNTGVDNSFFGNTAGAANTTGINNSFFGDSAGQNTTTGNGNSFFGRNAGNSNTIGAGNSFFGLGAGFLNTASNNSFFGVSAGGANTTGATNSFFGGFAGASNTIGNSNSFFGRNAGLNNTTADDNSFFGYAAGGANTTGAHNSFFGNSAGAANSTASNNSFFGDSAGLNNTTGAGNSFFGAGSGQTNTTGGSNSFFGQNAGNSNTSGGNNSFFGAAAAVSNTTGSANSVFGNNAGFNNTTGNANSFFGNFAGNANTVGENNSFFGANAGQANTTAFYNSFFGTNAGAATTSGGNNSFFGGQAGFSNTVGDSNSFFGAGAGIFNTLGAANTFTGSSAGQGNTTGSANSFFGGSAGFSNTTGQSNSFFGYNAGRSNSTGDYNVAVGRAAGSSLTTGSENVVVGHGAGSSLTAGNNNIYIANPGVANESNAIRIGAGGVQNAVYFPGIGTSVVTGSAVLISGTGQLGVAASSRRYKKDIHDMGSASSRLMLLRPVTFLYRPEYVHGDQTLQYGLIAEEVARIYPELVEYSADGQPQAVRYHLLSSMLLNEVQKQQRTIQSLEQQSGAVKRENMELKTRLDQLERSISKLQRLARKPHISKRR